MPAPDTTHTPEGRRPRHVAIIMDGNGRWAAARGMPRGFGHKRGVETLKAIVRHAGDVGLECLTVYSFSSENWTRPQDEVQDLLGLVRHFVRSDLAELHGNGVRIKVLGSRAGVPDDIVGLIDEAETLTSANAGLTLGIAFNYGSRDEMLRAVRSLVEAGEAPADWDAIEAKLDTAGLPPLDLLIRTGGEHRLSNFLLLQAAYAELVFSNVLWPDFGAEAFDAALEEYAARERRFGGLAAKAT